MLSNFLNDRGAKTSNVQRVWPPNFGGYVWDDEIGDGMYRPLQLQLGCLSELKKVLQSSRRPENVVRWNVKELLKMLGRAQAASTYSIGFRARGGAERG
jgi:hypothetical protein